ncbi:hypothetical protein Tco_0091768 [Tanacetum coccineum]
MVAYLEKSTGSAGFFNKSLITSHVSYHLCTYPRNQEVCVSLLRQFWRSAEIVTDDDGSVKIHATIDGHSLSISEGSLRRHLKLDDQDGITSLPTTEIFAQLALMGYATNSDKLTFQKGAFSPQWRFLIHNILHCLSPKKTAWEQFSSNIAAAVICLATDRKFNFSRMIFDHMVSNISSPHKFLMYPRFIQLCLDMQRHKLQQHSRVYLVPSLTMKVFSNMKRITKGFSGQEVALFPNMLDAAESSPSRSTSSPSPTPTPSPTLINTYSTSPSTPTPQPSPTQLAPNSPWLRNYHPPTPMTHLLQAGVIKFEKAMKNILDLFLSDAEGVEDDSPIGRKFSNEEITPTEVIHEQEGSGKASDEISTAGKKKDTVSEEVPPVSTAEVHIVTSSEALGLKNRCNEEQRAAKMLEIARDARQWEEEEKKKAMDEAESTKKIDWNDPSVLRYHTLKMKPKSIAQ